MKKKEITVEVFSDINYKTPFRFNDIKDIVQENDIIESGWSEGFYTENNSVDGHYFMSVKRRRIETDDEYAKRKLEWTKLREESKKKRHETYLKLRDEFEKENL